MRRTHRYLAAACIALWLVTSLGVASAEEAKVLVRNAELDKFPQVRLQVALPSGIGGEDSVPEFSVLENTRKVKIVESKVLDSEPIDVILVVDTSGSMEGRSMEAAKEAAEAFVRELEPGSKVGVISFSDRPRLASPIAPRPETIAIRSLRRLQAGGETALYDALNVASREAARAGVKRPIVVLLSDGGDTASRQTLDVSVRALKSAKIPVLVVALPSAEADHAVLRSIASQTGGRFSTVSDAESLTTFYKDLAQRLQTTWALTYVSRRPSTAELEVEVLAKVGDETASGLTFLRNPLFEGPLETAEPLQPSPPASVVTLYGAAVLVFAAVFCFVVATALFLARPRVPLEHLKYYEQLQGEAEVTDAAETYSGKIAASIISAVDHVAGKRGFKRFAFEQLDRAGLPLRPTEYLIIHFLAVVAAGVVTQAISGNLLLSILAVLVTTGAPLVYLQVKADSRRKAFDQQLPDVLSLIAGSLRAGWGLQQSVDLVVEQMAPPISAEFARAQTEVRLGRSVEDALEIVADRIQSVDFTWAVAAIRIQRDVGGNLAEVLDVVAATIRDRMALKRQISTLTAEGRLSAVILIGLPFLLVGMLYFANRSYLMQMFVTIPGWILLFVGVVLLIIGIVWIRRVIEIEV